MRIGVLGTGAVGQALAGKLVECDHDVVMGSRNAGNEKAVAWAAQFEARGGQGTFADAAAHGEVVINATAGMASLEALQAAGAKNLSGKPILDVSNPLDFSGGFPPRLGTATGDSVAEQIQREFPDARVVKVLNTMNADLMVEPTRVPGEHNVFMAGDDDDAKRVATDLLVGFGWDPGEIVDVGGVVASRGLEAYVLFWVDLMQALGTPHFNIKVVR